MAGNRNDRRLLSRLARADSNRYGLGQFTHAPYCVSGERACPPEDIGGVYGFVDFVAAIKDPSHEQHEDFMEWHGPFDRDKFDTLAATKRMRKGLPKW